MVRFFVPGRPHGKGRPRFYNGRAVTDDQTRAYEQQSAWAYRASGGRQLPDEQFVRVCITQIMPIPKSATKARREAMLAGQSRPSAKPDIDNVIKAVLDALNGIAYKDDARVVELEARKVYGNEPGVAVEIHAVDG